MKHYNKTLTKNTKQKCKVCDKKITTTDVLYSSTLNKCWTCDRLNKEPQKSV